VLERVRMAAVGGVAALAAAAGAIGHPAPGRDLEGLAAALARAAGGGRVAPATIRWEPTEGTLGDATLGRWALFVATSPGDDAGDVWRARVRVTPDGSVVEVADAYDLTSTPLGDDHQLVVNGTHAAFATRAYGQEQSVTLLDLDGEGAANRATSLGDRVMAAATNFQRTGSIDGVGRVDVALDAPARGVGLELGDDALTITLAEGDPRRPPVTRRVRLDLATGAISPEAPGLHADVSMHLEKRFSHWLVDTLRAVPWIGAAPVAWAEDRALELRDSARRMSFGASHDATDIVAAVEPPPPVLDTSAASIEEAHWPPARVPTIWKTPEPSEGEWVVPPVPWLKHVPGVAGDAPSPFYETFVRPDEERPYAKVILVAMDLRQLDLQMEAGVEDPEPLTGPHGSGRIPRDPAASRLVAAAFNGAFKTEHGHYGMMVHKRVLLPPVPAAATVVVMDDGRVGFGTWGTGKGLAGIAGVAEAQIDSFRQNLDPLIDHGQLNPTKRNLWGFTLPGKGAQTERTGLCVTTSGHMIYAWGDDLSATSLAKAMQMAGCDYAMHLDMNPFHTGFIFMAIEDLAAHKFKSQLLTPSMSIPTDRYINYAPKDFFYVRLHDPTPPAVGGASPWQADGGLQPPPRWLPGIWEAKAAQDDVELLDVEPGRATWRLRAGTKDAPASAPLRELAGEEATRVLLAAGLGVASERHPLGLATDGRLAMTLKGGADHAVVSIGADGRLAVLRADEAPVLGPHDDLVEVPALVWDGVRDEQALAEPPAPSRGAGPLGSSEAGPRLRKTALGIMPSGRVLLARGDVRAFAPLADLLTRAGCTRIVALDRGFHATGFVDRAGTAEAPRGRYEETVLYALGAPLRPNGFRFDPSSPVAKAPAGP
jgi:hypothetical protein